MTIDFKRPKLLMALLIFAVSIQDKVFHLSNTYKDLI